VRTLNVPQPCRSVQSASELEVRAIEPSGVVLLEHPRRGVAESERDEDGVRAGLLFVSLSINLDRILWHPWLPRRAGVALMLMFEALIIAIVGLVPGQSRRALGIGLLVVRILWWARYHRCLRSRPGRVGGRPTAIPAAHGIPCTTAPGRREIVARAARTGR
jgi:hypothetical protein